MPNWGGHWLAAERGELPRLGHGQATVDRTWAEHSHGGKSFASEAGLEGTADEWMNGRSRAKIKCAQILTS